MSNNPPFKIGERVVCVDDKPINNKINPIFPLSTVIKRGQEYTIYNIKKDCCGWLVDIGGKLPADPMPDLCSSGKHWYTNSEDIYWLLPCRFRYLETSRHASAIVTVKELLDVKEERGVDHILEPVKENNHV